MASDNKRRMSYTARIRGDYTGTGYIYDYKMLWAAYGLVEVGRAVKKGGGGVEGRRRRQRRRRWRLLDCDGL